MNLDIKTQPFCWFRSQVELEEPKVGGGGQGGAGGMEGKIR